VDRQAGLEANIEATEQGPLQRSPAESPSKSRRLRSEHGQGVVEFALILPVFMLLILGLLDFGSAYNVHNNMTQLAGEAVRFAAVNSCGGSACSAAGGGSGSIETQVQMDADNGCLQGNGCGATGPQQPLSVCFFYPNGSGAAGNPVTAVVKTTYRWLPFLDLGTDINLKASATMRIEVPLTGSQADVYTKSSSC
jgi:hypothetical protein